VLGKHRWDHRYRACLEAKSDPVFKRLGSHYDEAETVRFIESVNSSGATSIRPPRYTGHQATGDATRGFNTPDYQVRG
jgi:hypothetical protein